MPRDLADAVQYHYGAFPPRDLDFSMLIGPVTEATASLSRYDEMLRTMLNSEILLTPLRKQDAVVSSRMEGTISTLDEVLKLEADEDAGERDAQNRARLETIEVLLHSRALKMAQDRLADGAPFGDWLVREAHQMLLAFGRGASKQPGSYKTEQNYVGEGGRRGRIRFNPIAPEHLSSGMDALFDFIRAGDMPPILRTALAHVEFEALHPFEDGNGRVGRMLIALTLWHHRLLGQPHFYVSAYLEEHKEEYIERMRRVSSHGEWSEWCCFFMGALDAQARENIRVAGEIQALYAEMRDRFSETLSSRWSNHALDFIFANPVFRNNRFKEAAGIPEEQTANRFTRRLTEAGLLTVLQAPAGRRAGLYAFEPLLAIVREL